MPHLLGQRAVVIGAGIGGLATAGALAGYFGHVDVLERDHLPEVAQSRSGTPQDRHSHALLAGGLQAIGAIFPGLERDLESAGAVRVQVAQDLCYERPGIGMMPQRDFGGSVLCATRPLIEAVVRRRVQGCANISLHPGTRATEIRPAASAGAPASVRFGTPAGRCETFEADFVLDASGRGALTLSLFDAAGWSHPEVTEVGVDLQYATVLVKVPADAPAGWKFALTMPEPPKLARHGVLIPVEDNWWTVTIADHGGVPIESWDAFLEALRGLATPTIYHALRRAERPSHIHHFGFRASRWRHFERLPRLPLGVLPIADAVCRFNPIHGQGMSSAGQQARLLQQVLRQAADEAAPISTVQARFMAAVATVLQTPWNMSTGADLAFPATRGERPDNFQQMQVFESELFRAAVVDPVVHHCLMDVAQLLLPDSAIHDPDIQRRIEAVSAGAAA